MADNLRRCYLFVGNDSSAIASALHRVKIAALGDEDSAEAERFDSSDGVTARLMASAATPAFFGPRRFVALRNALALSSEEMDRMIESLPSLPDYACVAITAEENRDADFRQEARSDAKAKKLQETVQKIGEVINCNAPTAAAGRDELINYAGAKNVKLPKQAAALLWGLCQEDFVDARGELDKLIDFVGLAEEVTEEDIRTCVQGTSSARIFGFIDAVTEGKVGEALTQLDALLDSRPKDDEVVFLTILPQLGRQYRLLWQARALVEDGVAAGNWKELAKDARLPKEHNLGAAVARTEFLSKKYDRLARSYSLRRLVEAMDMLARADMAMKGMAPGLDAREIMTRMTLDLCGLAKR